jgi:DNA replication protein DnaC
LRRLARIRLPTIDDFALQPMDAIETADFYELVVARHHNTSTVLTSNRSLDELPAMIRDAPLAAAVDRFTSTTHVIPSACQITHSRTSFG